MPLPWYSGTTPTGASPTMPRRGFAGSRTGVAATAPDASEEDWDRQMAVNLKGTF
jgi:NAD(P)-dependent dehydrogenase (short-subunit alcohol dehydrogenase family)